MAKYCIVVEGAVTWGPGPILERITLADGTTRTSLDELNGAELLELGIWPVEETIPSYDPQTQRLVQPPTLTVDAENSQVLAEYTVENIPDPSTEEQRRLTRQADALSAWDTLATALDVPVKAPDIELYRRIQRAVLQEDTFEVEIDNETRTLTPAELFTLAKEARSQYRANGGNLDSLADPATSGIDLTFQFEFHPAFCLVRLIRAQWHTTGYDLPPTAAFCCLMSTMSTGAAQDQYPFSYVGDWGIIDDINETTVRLEYLQLYWTYYGIAVPEGGTAAASTGYKYPIPAAEDFSSFFPVSGVRKITRIVSYTESVFAPANLPVHALPAAEPVSNALAVSAAWPDFTDTAKWMFMGMWASTVEDYHTMFADTYGHSGKHYAFAGQHSYQPTAEAAPSCDYSDMYGGSDFRGHKIGLMINAGAAQEHADIYLTGGRNGTALATVQRDVAFPGFNPNGEAFNCA